ncbi:MAG: molybdenum transporter substrate-binding protein [Betaproteobacteria bacterium]|nr:molybdenum transporter substrate-binding protein [Betaproteobacteria bacterium]
MRNLNLKAAALAALLFAHGAGAAELVVFSAGAAKSAVQPLVESFEKASGHKVSVSFGTMGLIQEKLGRGERADVLIVSSEVAEDLAKRKVIVEGSAKALTKVGIGVAVNEKTATLPDISTPEAFRQTLLNAKSIVYIDPAKGTSGKYLVTLFDKLGITAQVNAKARLGEGGYIVEPVGKGEVELGLHQISEILPVKGVKLVGPLPEALQKWTVYSAAITPGSASPAVARELITYLSGPAAKPVYAAKGFAAAD